MFDRTKIIRQKSLFDDESSDEIFLKQVLKKLREQEIKKKEKEYLERYAKFYREKYVNKKL